jgi:hypothetical protein
LDSLKLRGVIRDVSKNGLRIELAFPVNKETRLKISLPKKAIIFAVARYCRRTGDVYQVGVQIESIYFAKHTSPCSSEPDTTDSLRETGELARSLVEYHTSWMIRYSDWPQERRPPVSDGVN